MLELEVVVGGFGVLVCELEEWVVVVEEVLLVLEDVVGAAVTVVPLDGAATQLTLPLLHVPEPLPEAPVAVRVPLNFPLS